MKIKAKKLEIKQDSVVLMGMRNTRMARKSTDKHQYYFISVFPRTLGDSASFSSFAQAIDSYENHVE
jgi:hypothetical protein